MAREGERERETKTIIVAMQAYRTRVASVRASAFHSIPHPFLSRPEHGTIKAAVFLPQQHLQTHCLRPSTDNDPNPPTTTTFIQQLCFIPTTLPPLFYTRRLHPYMAESDKELWKLPYYHGLLPREDTIPMLKNNGDFLVRKSEETAGAKRSFVLSVLYKGQPKHFIFREEKGRIAVDFKQDQGFRNIREFVEKHVEKKDTVCSGKRIIISKLVPKRDWELSHMVIKRGRKLGSGAFGEVREGRFERRAPGTATGREELKVAIKEATLTKCTKEQIKEFMNEARVMRRLKHMNVIEFYGVAVGEEPLMIVMELATDGALKDYLQQHNRSVRSKLFMCMGAASGLAHIHEKNIIHCDIAARNCLYSGQKVKIADFGLARELARNEKAITLDKDQRLPIKWLAPETMKDRICTKKTDAWAFGILCWEIFENGSPPYADVKNNNEVARMVVRGERLRFNATAPAQFSDYIIKQAWHGEAAGRCSMQGALEWIDKNMTMLLANVDTVQIPNTSAKEKSTKTPQKEEHRR